MKNGGACLVRDKYEPGLIWLEIVADKFYVSKRTILRLLQALYLSGYTHVGTDTKHFPRLNRYWEIMGFQKIKEFDKGGCIWAVKLT